MKIFFIVWIYIFDVILENISHFLLNVTTSKSNQHNFLVVLIWLTDQISSFKQNNSASCDTRAPKILIRN